VNDDDGADLSLLHFRLSQVLSRYSRGIDRRNWNLVKSAFHADAVIDDGLTTGSVASFIDGMASRSTAITEMMHLNGNSLVLEYTTDLQQVLVDTPCVAWSRGLHDASNPGLFLDSKLLPVGSSNARVRTIANRYLDLLVEWGGELRILFRRVIWEWVTVIESDRVAPFADSYSTSSRDDHDPSYSTIVEIQDRYLSSMPDKYLGKVLGISQVDQEGEPR
jgi:SnoaL-like domain